MAVDSLYNFKPIFAHKLAIQYCLQTRLETRQHEEQISKYLNVFR